MFRIVCKFLDDSSKTSVISSLYVKTEQFFFNYLQKCFYTTWFFSIYTEPHVLIKRVRNKKYETVQSLKRFPNFPKFIKYVFYFLAVWPNELLLANRMDGLHNRQSLELRHSIMQKCLTNYPQEWFNFRNFLKMTKLN